MESINGRVIYLQPQKVAQKHPMFTSQALGEGNKRPARLGNQLNMKGKSREGACDGLCRAHDAKHRAHDAKQRAHDAKHRAHGAKHRAHGAKKRAHSTKLRAHVLV
ncbi:MAG: hypothetical protein GY822_00600 [Deltaproteobacteria bacterium]|nr:hypothetical protein [Deltaproteobacteria bacterium]